MNVAVWRRLSCDRRGAVQVEYVMLCLCIALACVAAWKYYGQDVNALIRGGERTGRSAWSNTRYVVNQPRFRNVVREGRRNAPILNIRNRTPDAGVDQGRLAAERAISQGRRSADDVLGQTNGLLDQVASNPGARPTPGGQDRLGEMNETFDRLSEDGPGGFDAVDVGDRAALDQTRTTLNERGAEALLQQGRDLSNEIEQRNGHRRTPVTVAAEGMRRADERATEAARRR